MNTIALFDFDHTLYDGDSMLDFTKIVKGKQYYLGMMALMPWLVGLKLGLLDNQEVKEKFLTHFFKGMEAREFESLGKQFSFSTSDRLDRKLKWTLFEHLEKRHKVVIVTASMPQWILGWAEGHNIAVIGSTVEVADGLLTGKLEGKNCYGPEKVRRIKERFELSVYDHIVVYGSGKGDREMLSLAR